MKKFKKIAIVDTVKIADDFLPKFQLLSDSQIIFPSIDSRSDNETIERIGDADAILGSWLTTINKNILDNCPNLRYICICGTSMANIDLDAVKLANVIIDNVADYADEATAEYIFTQLLMLVRGVGEYQWREDPSGLNGKTIGIVGLGAVGKKIARLALGFDMKVLYNSLSHKPELEKQGIEYRSLVDLLRESDFVSLHVPKNLIILTEKEFSQIKKGSVLIDTCLGVVFDGKAFLDWIAKGKNYAIFDCSKKEFFDKLDSIPRNVLGVENGIAGITIESRERLSKKVLNHLSRFLGK